MLRDSLILNNIYMAKSNYHGIKTICNTTICRRYGLTSTQLNDLIYSGALHPITGMSKLYFNDEKVRAHFEKETRQFAPRVVISLKDICKQYGIDENDVNELNKVVAPLPIKDEKNIFYGYKEICAFFDK